MEAVVDAQENSSCRMYENELPAIDDCVMISVRRIEEMGAYVSLLEYNDREGMILLSELSRRRIRSISKLIRVGKIMSVIVLRVDQDKGYIDLSKRRVTPEDISKCEERYAKSKAVHGIIRHTATVCGVTMESIYKAIGWDLAKRYGHAFDGFRAVIRDPETVLAGYELDAKMKEVLLDNIKRRLTPQPLKMRADVEVSCFNEHGIDAIVGSLSAAEEFSQKEDSEIPVSIRLVAPPAYVFTTLSSDKEAGLSLLSKAIAVAQEEMKKYDGIVVVKDAPRIVSESDEKKLATILDEKERENRQVSGDDDDSDASMDDDDNEESSKTIE